MNDKSAKKGRQHSPGMEILLFLVGAVGTCVIVILFSPLLLRMIIPPPSMIENLPQPLRDYVVAMVPPTPTVKPSLMTMPTTAPTMTLLPTETSSPTKTRTPQTASSQKLAGPVAEVQSRDVGFHARFSCSLR